MNPSPSRQWIAILIGVSATPVVTRGQAISQKGSTVTIDHSQCIKNEPPCLLTASLSLKKDEAFRIVVTNTDSSRFSYSLTGVRDRASEAASVQSETKKPPPNHTVEMPFVHDAQFGGYILHVRRKQNAGDNDDYADATATITVTTSRFRGAFAGGFTASGLTNPKFAVVPRKIDDTTTVSVFVRETGKEDVASLGVASFVHVWHTKYPGLTGSFGLGLTTNSSPSYYLGGSLRFGTVAALTLGATASSVAAPPSGVYVDSVVTDPNVLNNLDDQIKLGFFVAVSFGFIGGAEDAIKKPFKGEDGTTGTGSGGATPPAQPPADEPGVGEAAELRFTLAAEGVVELAGTLGQDVNDGLTVRVMGESSIPGDLKIMWEAVTPGTTLGDDQKRDQMTFVTDPDEDRKATVFVKLASTGNSQVVKARLCRGAEEDPCAGQTDVPEVEFTIEATPSNQTFKFAGTAERRLTGTQAQELTGGLTVEVEGDPPFPNDLRIVWSVTTGRATFGGGQTTLITEPDENGSATTSVTLGDEDPQIIKARLCTGAEPDPCAGQSEEEGKVVTFTIAARPPDPASLR